MAAASSPPSSPALDELETKASALAARVAARAERCRDEDGFAPRSEADNDDDAAYFAMKQELLTTYCGLLSFYLLKKARGESVRDHPVLKRLYELRLVFEKLRLLDSKLKHQLDKVLARADDDAAAALRPRLDTAAAPEASTEGGAYKAPRGPAPAEDDDDGSDASDDPIDARAPPGEKTERKERSTRARRAEIEHLLRNQSDRPELAGSGGGFDDALGTGQKAARRERRRKERKEQESWEEDRFMRLDTNKKAKKKRRTADFASSLDDLI